MKKFWLLIFLFPFLAPAQTNVGIQLVSVAPSGSVSCRANPRMLVSGSTAGTIYTPQGTAPTCSWAAIGGATGVTSVSGTTSEIAVANGTTTAVVSVAAAFDISGHTSTAPIKKGTSLPATCAVGQLYNKTDATATSVIYACTSTNTWTAQGASGGGSSITQGTYASLPGTCTVSDVYFPTNSLINFLRCSTTNTWSAFVPSFVGLVFPPVIGNFTAVNTGTATFDGTLGGVRMSTLSGDATMNAHMLVKAAPMTPYHAITCIAIPIGSPNSNAQIGMVFRNSVSGGLNTWGIFQNVVNTYISFYLSNPTTYGGTLINTTNVSWSANSPGSLCLRIGDDGVTNRTYDISVDGRINWINIGSDTRINNFIADQVGLLVNGGLQEAWFLDYEETN